MWPCSPTGAPSTDPVYAAFSAKHNGFYWLFMCHGLTAIFFFLLYVHLDLISNRMTHSEEICKKNKQKNPLNHLWYKLKLGLDWTGIHVKKIQQLYLDWSILFVFFVTTNHLWLLIKAFYPHFPPIVVIGLGIHWRVTWEVDVQWDSGHFLQTLPPAEYSHGDLYGQQK